MLKKSIVSSDTLDLIQKHLIKARTKHPNFCNSLSEMISIAVEELGELAAAVNDGKIKNAQDEAADTIAVLIRFLEGELNGGIE